MGGFNGLPLRVIRMTTKLTQKEIVEILNKVTKRGNPLVMGTPFYVSGILSGQLEKYFYGEIDEDECKLSLNRVFIGVPFIINADFEPESDITIVNYKIKPILFGYWWIRLFPIALLVIGVIKLIIDKEDSLGEFLITGALLCSVPLLLLIWHMNWSKKQMEIIFKKLLRLK